MAKQWPDYMGTYKGICMEWGITKTAKSGMPQFVVKLFLTEYYDQNESKWYDVSDNNYSVNAYLALFGRKGSVPDGEIVPTLNHTQVCTVFGWDGCGFTQLTTPGAFDGKIIQVRIEASTQEKAKCPIQVSWIDVEDADPSNKLRTLAADDVKKLESEFAGLFASKKAPVKAVSAPATKQVAKPVAKPPVTVDDSDADTPAPPEDDATRKANLLAKSKRLLASNKKSDDAPAPAPTTKAAKPTAKPAAKPAAKAAPKPAVKAPTPEPAADPDDTTTADDGVAVPDDYNKHQAWLDVVELKSPDCDDETLNATWAAAIAEIAPGGDEDQLDAAGWWKVKETVLADIGNA